MKLMFAWMVMALVIGMSDIVGMMGEGEEEGEEIEYLDDDEEAAKDIAEDQQKLDELNQKIAPLEKAKKFSEALSLYGEIARMVIYWSGQFKNPATIKQLDSMEARIKQATEVIKKEAERLEKADNIDAALKVYWLVPGKFAQKIWKYNVPIINDYYSKAQASEAQKKIPEALKWYSQALKELEKIFDDDNDIILEYLPEEEIGVMPYQDIPVLDDDIEGFSPEQKKFVENMRDTAVKKVAALQGGEGGGDLKKAEALASNHKYAEAYAILNKIISPDAMRLKAKIKKQEDAWKAQQEQQEKPKKEGAKEDWVFLRKIAEKNAQYDDWHIENGNLEINKNSKKALDFISREPFATLVVEAQQEKRPFILVGVRGKDEGSAESKYSFFDHSIIEYLQNEKWQDPDTRRVPDAAEIYVAGDDGKFDFLSVMLTSTQVNPKANDNPIFAKLAVPDKGTYKVIADLFQQDAVNYKKNPAKQKEAAAAAQQAQKWLIEAAKYSAAPKPAPGNLVQALNSLTTALNHVSGALK